MAWLQISSTQLNPSLLSSVSYTSIRLLQEGLVHSLLWKNQFPLGLQQLIYCNGKQYHVSCFFRAGVRGDGDGRTGFLLGKGVGTSWLLDSTCVKKHCTGCGKVWIQRKLLKEITFLSEFCKTSRLLNGNNFITTAVLPELLVLSAMGIATHLRFDSITTVGEMAHSVVLAVCEVSYVYACFFFSLLLVAVRYAGQLTALSKLLL